MKRQPDSLHPLCWSGVGRRLFLVLCFSSIWSIWTDFQPQLFSSSTTTTITTNLNGVVVSALEWDDVVTWGTNHLYTTLDGVGDEDASSHRPLSQAEVSAMRVRDIKRRLSRRHGYSAEELSKILDKKELMHALRFEEHKEELKRQEVVKRALFWRTIGCSILAIVVVAGWPVWMHLWEVANVNFVVYTDRKSFEFRRAIELESLEGMIGVFFMAVVDILQFWLSVSILLSWVIARSKYMFPTPNIPFRPAQFMGEQVAKGPLAQYGLNIGPMILTWTFRFLNTRLESWTGQAFARSHRKQRHEQKQRQREQESPEERAARKAARKAAKKAAQEEAEAAERRQQERAQFQRQQQQHWQQQQQQQEHHQKYYQEDYAREEQERLRQFFQHQGQRVAEEFGMFQNETQFDTENEENEMDHNGFSTMPQDTDNNFRTTVQARRREEFQQHVGDFDDLD